MNRAEKRRQQKLAHKADKKNRSLMSSKSQAEYQALTSQQAQAIRDGLLHQAAGRLAQAESQYRQVLSSDPDQPVALHLLGLLASQCGDHNKAADFMAQALANKPDYAEAHYNYGNVLLAMGNPEQAKSSYQKAITIKPDYVEAHYNHGNVLFELGLLDDAINSYHAALSVNPDYAAAHSNLGNVLKLQGRLNEAVNNFSTAVSLQPENAEFHNNLGVALKELGQLDKAVDCFHNAIDLNPDIVEVHNNLGNALKGLWRLDEAVSSYHKALAINPDYPEAYNNLALALKELGKLDQAVKNYHKALTIDPDYAEAHCNLGNALKGQGKLTEAMTSFLKALEIEPGFAGAERNILYTILSIPDLSVEELFAHHLRFGESQTQHIVPWPEKFNNAPIPERRLRIGYMSSDFRDHPVGRVMLQALESHDPENVEVFCYAHVQHQDEMTEKFRSNTDHWRSIEGIPDSEVARMVRADGIDVLICLAARFDSNRPLVCAYQAAPIQISMHDGATSGLKQIDYWMSDNYLHPADTKELFTEQLYRLPALIVWPAIESAPPIEPLPVDRSGVFTFGSFNNPARIYQDVIEIWAAVLKAVPGSRLLFKYKNLFGQPSLTTRMRESFSACGVEPERLIFKGTLDTHKEHLALYNQVDIALDSFPMSGNTTTFQALWMGVPVVSLVGETFISRTSGSLLRHVGLTDLAVESPVAYVACVEKLTRDLPQLRDLRKNLQQTVATSLMCDGAAYARSLEDAYREMWRHWCAR